VVTRLGRGSGGGFEGDAKAQGGESADVVSDLAGRVDAMGVVVGPQIVEACGRSESRCQTMTRIERATATRALSLPRRLTRRR